MTVTVSVKGQIVIPSKMRKRYHLGPRSKIELIDAGSEIIIVPLPQMPFQASRGILAGVTSHDVVLARRQERKREHA
ncbi:MAG: AbrB/MazE/SpoVT family DNA-binding domain-containing protein [Candidatus Omnitrophica bacterium]|nr:AbrB/MazE/SpoVT family DNA-binding domain-containing protein [Candidatus Omnitrophota bacterium]